MCKHSSIGKGAFCAYCGSKGQFCHNGSDLISLKEKYNQLKREVKFSIYTENTTTRCICEKQHLLNEVKILEKIILEENKMKGNNTCFPNTQNSLSFGNIVLLEGVRESDTTIQMCDIGTIRIRIISYKNDIYQHIIVNNELYEIKKINY